MAKRKFFVGMIGLLLVFALSIAGCGVKCSNNGDCYYSDSNYPHKSVSTCGKESCAAYKASKKQYGFESGKYCDC
jgi:hypothetical protein